MTADITPRRRATRPPRPVVLRRLLAEFLGTAFLVCGVVGSGIMATQLTDDVGLQLLANTAATAALLVALILALGPTSGAHFNPVVTLADWVFGGIDRRTAVGYSVVQVAGGITGAIVANAMFDLPLVDWSQRDRSGADLWLGEIVATLGLLLVIFGVVRSGRASVAAFTVGGYIAAAYWFTSSTSFANPAVTVARSFSNSFAGIAPGSVPGFVIAQLIGALVAIGVVLVLFPAVGEVADRVVLPHDEPTDPEG